MDSRAIGQSPRDVFVDTNDTVYVAAHGLNQVLVWVDGSSGITPSLSYSISMPLSLFVTSDASIYASHGSERRANIWSLHDGNSTPAMHVGGRCFGLFVDMNDTLYCSLYDTHQVIAKSLGTDLNGTRVVAGTGSAGGGSYMLHNPRGIFVDTSFTLYVADPENHRIQKFAAGEVNGTTVAGRGGPGNISLKEPFDIIVDGNGYLFILDTGNNRIVGSGSDGFRCLAGCGGEGSAFDQLWWPKSFSFDSYGNMLVVDTNNKRIQKFVVERSCGK